MKAVAEETEAGEEKSAGTLKEAKKGGRRRTENTTSSSLKEKVEKGTRIKGFGAAKTTGTER